MSAVHDHSPIIKLTLQSVLYAKDLPRGDKMARVYVLLTVGDKVQFTSMVSNINGTSDWRDANKSFSIARKSEVVLLLELFDSDLTSPSPERDTFLGEAQVYSSQAISH